jgi:streptomycin 6-kinase
MLAEKYNTNLTVKFCVTSRSGLGHVRRICNIVEELRAFNASLDTVLLTNSPVAELSPSDASSFGDIRVLAKDDMAAALACLPRGPVVVDTAVVDRLGFLADPLCLVLRETVGARLPAFRLEAGRQWDQVIVPAPTSDWTVDAAEIGARAVGNVGWIYRSRPVGTGIVLPPKGAHPRVLVATGGGGTAVTAASLRATIDGVLSSLRGLLPEVEILQVAGPLLPAEGRLAEANRLIDVGSRLNEAFAEADAVVSTVGYNSILELAVVDTPSLLVPIARTFDDQRARAERWGPALGLSHSDSIASAAWLFGVLTTRSRRPAMALPPSGAREAAGLIGALTERSVDGLLHKPLHDPLAAARRASSIFAAGLRTLPARADGDSLAMFRVGGSTLRERIVPDGTAIRSATKLARTVAPSLALALSSLSTMPRATSGLARFDPFAKIRPRLVPGSVAKAAMGEDLSQRAADLAGRIERQLSSHEMPTTIVHGDFHVGQVLLPPDGGRPIIIDLDDLAVGHREADLANLIAHVVSSRTLYEGPVAQGFRALVRALVNETDLLDRDLLGLYGAAALLRRALKLSEQGERIAWLTSLLSAANALSHDTRPRLLARRATAMLSSPNSDGSRDAP